MTKVALEAKKREVFGRKVKALRRQGLLPANIYGKKVKSLAVSVSLKDFTTAFKTSGETNVIELKIEKEKSGRPVLATNLQKDPVSDEPIHVDFYQVDLTQKVTVPVPIEVQGEAPAVKEKGAVLIRLLDEVEVEALPKDLPDKLVVDISELREFNDSILIKDLKVGANVAIQEPGEEAVVMVQEPKAEEAPQPAAEAAPEEGVAEGEAAVAGKEEGEVKPPAESEAQGDRKTNKDKKE